MQVFCDYCRDVGLTFSPRRARALSPSTFSWPRTCFLGVRLIEAAAAAAAVVPPTRLCALQYSPVNTSQGTFINISPPHFDVFTPGIYLFFCGGGGLGKVPFFFHVLKLSRRIFYSRRTATFVLFFVFFSHPPFGGGRPAREKTRDPLREEAPLIFHSLKTSRYFLFYDF